MFVYNWKLMFQVARWEFGRFFKVKDLLTSSFVMILLGGLFWGAMKLIDLSQKEAQIVVLNADVLEFELRPESRITIDFRPDLTENQLRNLVGQRKLDALLILRSIDEAELIVHKEPPWLDELQAALSQARRTARLNLIDLSGEELANLLAPIQVRVEFYEAGNQPKSKAEKVFVVVIISLMLMGILTGNSYLFIGITGEKQLRVTEQVVSAISPQVWIDGKIVALTGIALANLANLALTGLISLLGLNLLGMGFDIPFQWIHPLPLLKFTWVASLGFFFWFAFFGAIAATINDPNTSARSSLIMLPLVPLAFAFAVFKDPDTFLMKVLSILPLTSPTVLSARMVLSQVGILEFVVASICLIVAIWLLRKAAGKIFELGILIYGKEPSWREMMRCVKAKKEQGYA